MTSKLRTQQHTRRGYVTLISVLIVGAVASAIAVALLLSGIGAARGSFVVVQSAQAAALAHACAEEGLEQIRLSISFTGSGNLSLGQGACSYTVSNTGGNTRAITASSTVGTIVRKESVTISAINPSIVINTWTEVAD